MNQLLIVLLAGWLGQQTPGAFQLARCKTPDYQVPVARILFSGFTRQDVISLSHLGDTSLDCQGCADEPMSAAGLLADRKIAPDRDAVELTLEDGSLSVVRREKSGRPLILVLRLPVAGFPWKPADGGPETKGSFATDGQPVDVGIYPYTGPLILHDGQIVPGDDWISLIMGKTDLRPTRVPVRLADGRIRVPGRLVFEAAVKKVDPVVPEAFDWKERLEYLVLVRVELDQHGKAKSVYGLQGPPPLVKAVRQALLQWEFDTSIFLADSDTFVTNLPFKFVKPRE